MSSYYDEEKMDNFIRESFLRPVPLVYICLLTGLSMAFYFFRSLFHR